MKFMVNGEVFCRIASSVIKCLNLKDSGAQTLFLIEDNKLVIRCTSDTSYSKGEVLIYNVEQEEGEDTKWLVSNLQLASILSILSNYKDKTAIQFVMSSNQRIFEVRYEKLKLKLPIEEAPIFEDTEEIRKIASVDKAEFMSNVSDLMKLANSDPNSDHPMTCVHFFIEPTTLTLVATDAIGLAEIVVPIDDCEVSEIKLVKPNQLSLLMTPVKEDSIITLISTDTKFGYEDSNGTILLVSVSDYPHIDYKQFKNLVSTTNKMKFNKDELKFAVDSLFRLCNTNNRQTFIFKDNCLVVRNENEDMFKISTDSQFDDTVMSINYPSLSSLLNIMTSCNYIEWGEKEGGIRAIKFTCLNTNEDGEEEENENIFLTMIEG